MTEQASDFRSKAVFLAVLVLASAPTDADTGVPLYVAENGRDSGDCSARSTPCRSIGYALQVAGKNVQIRVAAGTYEIDDPSDLIYMVSGAVKVSGGHIADNDFSPSAGGTSIITGVPLEYRELLRRQGFHVIADNKGIDIERAAAAKEMLQTYQSAQIGSAAAACANGLSGGFSCNQIDLLSHVARQDISASPASVTDVWGFVDLNTNREYAIVGVNVGTAVFDVTDPRNPLEVGFVDGQAANWRDMKVYQFFDDVAGRWRAYAYVTTDGARDGLFVIDLGGLPHSISRVPYVSDFTNAHNVYITNIDYGTGIGQTANPPQLIVAGSGANNGQFRTYSLADPAAPAFVQRVGSAGYMHDATSLLVSDQRTAQCANPGAPCEVLIDFNEERVEFWDVTNSASPTLLARSAPYLNTGYVHSGWWSEDRQYIYAHDELDERNSGLLSTLRVFSIANLDSPELVGSWTGPTAAVDHNGFVRGNRYYMSNYTRGLTILDISNPTVPMEAGFFDTYSTSNNPIFAGAWGAYPFFHSGSIAVSDINSGMYLLEDQTRNVPQGSLTFEASSYAASEGEQASLSVNRSGGLTGAVSVDYEILAATASDADYQAVTGTLNWAAGDPTTRQIAVNLASDGETEGLERAIVRLINPGGGATLGSANVASLYLSDAGATSTLNLLTDTIGVPERGFGTAIVVVQRSGNANGAASVDFSITAGNATINSDFQGPANGTLSWADGDADPKSIQFAIVDDGLGEMDESFEVTLSNPLGADVAGAQSVLVTIEDGLGSNVAPNAVAGMSQTLAEGTPVTLNGSQSNDPDGDPLSYAWSQVGGPQTVSLQNANSATASFTAPSVASDTMLQFQLEVTDPRGLSNTAVTTVTVTNDPNAAPLPPAGGGGGGSPAPLALLLLGFYIRLRLSRTDFA